MQNLTRTQALAVVAAAPAVASLLWLAGGLMLPADDTLQLLSERLQAAAPRASPRTNTVALEPAMLLAQPLFAAPAGSSASALSQLRLQGLAETPGRSAALIAFGDKPATWIAVGEMRDGVTLRRVAPGLAVVDTIDGDKSLALGGDGGKPLGAASAPTLRSHP